MTRMYIKKVNGITFRFLVDFNLLKWKRMTDGLTLQKSAQTTSIGTRQVHLLIPLDDTQSRHKNCALL